MKNTYPIHPLAAAFPEMSAEEFADLKKSIKDHGLRHHIVLLDGQIIDGRNRDAACVELKIPPIFRNYDPEIDGEVPVAFVADENLNRRNLTTSQRAAIAAELEPYFAEAIKARKAAEAAKRKADKEAKEAAKKAAEEERQRAADHLAKSMTEPLDQSKPSEPGEVVYDKEEDDDDIPITSKEGPTTAAGQAAAAVGVSERSVHDAKDLKDKSPEQFEEVKSGAKSLNQARQDAAAMGESISPYRAECADMLEASQGEEFSQAIRDVTILKTTAELENFMKLAVMTQKEVAPYVCKGWKVADAVKFLKGEFTAGSTVGELMSYANAKGGDVTVEVGEFTITIAKKA